MPAEISYLSNAAIGFMCVPLLAAVIFGLFHYFKKDND